MSDIQTTQSKPFFSRPENITSLIFGVAVAGLGGWLLLAILPAIILLLESTIYAAAMLAGLIFTGFLVTNKKIRNIVSYGWNTLMKGITGQIAVIDPIGVMELHRDQLGEELEELDKNVDSLSGQVENLERLIGSNEEQRQHSMQIMDQAKNDPEKVDAFELEQFNAGSLQESNKNLQIILGKIKGLYAEVTKYRSSCDYNLKKLTIQIKNKSTERKAILSGYGAFTSVRKIVYGETDQKEMFDMALERMNDDMAMKIGEIKNFKRMSKGFVQGVDIEKGIYKTDALRQLDEWQKQKSGSKLRIEADLENHHDDDGVTEKRQSYIDILGS